MSDKESTKVISRSIVIIIITIATCVLLFWLYEKLDIKPVKFIKERPGTEQLK